MSTAPRLVSRPQPEDQAATRDLLVEIVAKAKLPTRHGFFNIIAFKNNLDGLDHIAIVQGDIRDVEELATRLHSECLTGDVFDSLRCDCRQQLERALEELGASEAGLILYMRQEGRGIGLANKVAAYQLQDQGLDTVEANLHLGFDDDMRDYHIAAEMIKLLGPKSIRLFTNNLKKVEALEHYGVRIAKREPIIIGPNPHNQRYLETKKIKSGHLLDP